MVQLTPVAILVRISFALAIQLRLFEVNFFFVMASSSRPMSVVIVRNDPPAKRARSDEAAVPAEQALSMLIQIQSY